MLGKLLKYDLSALSRILIPLHLIAIGVAVLGCGAGFVGYSASWLDSYAITSQMMDLVDLMTTFAALGLILCVLVLFSATIATFVVVTSRFYRNLFTDEGYLTLTLPVSAGQQVASKVLAGFIWMLVDGLVILACFLAIWASGEGFTPSTDITESIPMWLLAAASGERTLFFGETVTWLTVAGWMVRAALQMLFALLLSYASFALGAAIAARHKVACGIGLLVGIWFAYGIVIGTVSIGIGFAFSFDAGIAMDVISNMSACLEIVSIAGFWALCIWLLARKVNLP